MTPRAVVIRGTLNCIDADVTDCKGELSTLLPKMRSSLPISAQVQMTQKVYFDAMVLGLVCTGQAGSPCTPTTNIRIHITP